MKKNRIIILSLIISLFLSSISLANFDKDKISDFIKQKAQQNGIERTQNIYNKVSNKIDMFTGEKKQLADLLLQELGKSLSGNNMAIIKRENVDNNYKWDFKHIYADQESFDKDVEKVTNLMVKIKDYKGKLNDDKNLLEYLKLNDEIGILLDKTYSYINLQIEVDNENAKLDELSQKGNTLYSKYYQEIAFFGVETKAFSDEKLDQIINNKDFFNYRFIFKSIKANKQHILSQLEETLLAKLSNSYISFDGIYDNLIDKDILYPQIKNPEGNTIDTNYTNMYSSWNSYDREFRKEYTQKYYNTYKGFKNTLASLFVSNLKETTTYAKIRGYNSVLEQTFENDYLDTKIYDNLINITDKNLDTLHRYIKVRQDYLGLDKTHYYDTFIPIEKLEKNNFTYQETQNIILKGLSKLGSQYQSGLVQAFDENWVDVYPGEHKGGGAYATSISGVHPFVFINFNNTFEDLNVLTHELGHAINFYFSSLKQPFTLNGIIYPREVPSISNELILFRGLAENATSDKEKLFYLDRYLSTLYTNYRRATMYADFEKQMYDKAWNEEAISYQTLDSKFEELFKKYYGPDFAWDEYLDIERAIKPHFFNTYYTHKYAISAAIANQIATNIYDQKPGFTGEYIDFISAGTNGTATEIFKKIDIDLNDTAYIQSVADTENKILDEMEEIIKRIKK